MTKETNVKTTTVIITKSNEDHKEDYLHKAGNYYLIEGDLYLLAQVDDYKVAFIGVYSGNRFRDPVTVKHPYKIKTEELEAAGLDMQHSEPLQSIEVKYNL